MSRLRALWWRVSSSLWFVPAVMVLVAIVAAAALVEIEALLAADLAQRWPRLLGAAAEGARAILSAIATSMMTVAAERLAAALASPQPGRRIASSTG